MTVAYGETFDPCGSCLTRDIYAYNCCMNAPWDEWRSDKQEAGHLVEDMFEDKAGIGKTVGEGKGKWKTDRCVFEGVVVIKEKVSGI